MQVEHDTATQRFLAQTSSGTAVLAYRTRGREGLELYSTFVPEQDREQGIAGRLVETALEYARERNMRIIPSCPYVAWWLRQHPEHAELVV
jgi:predicted GNAT family acetyltransferase